MSLTRYIPIQRASASLVGSVLGALGQGYNWKKILTESLPNKLADFDPQARRKSSLWIFTIGPIGHDRVNRDDL